MIYVPIGLGVLTMGPVNLAMPGLIVIIYLVAMRDLGQIKSRQLGWGTLIIFVLAAPWYVFATIRGGCAGDLLMASNIERFISRTMEKTIRNMSNRI